MVKRRRTNAEIEHDLERIRGTAMTATSMAEIAKSLGLTLDQIRHTLTLFPVASNEIKAQLSLNRKNMKNQTSKETPEQPESFPNENSKRPENLPNENSEQPESLPINVLTPTILTEVEGGDVEPQFSVAFVLDTSIAELEDFDVFYDKANLSNTKIILTSIVIKELDKAQSRQDRLALNARHILAKAASNPEHFISVRIDETVGIPDDCIIAYCRKENIRKKVTLLTCDKVMALKARSYPYPVQVQYFSATGSLDGTKKVSNTSAKVSAPSNNSKYKVATLPNAEMKDDKLWITFFITSTQSICVISNGIKYRRGPRELQVGDEVLIATKKSKSYSLVHYRMISSDFQNNCEVIFSKTLPSKEILNVRNPKYSQFLQEFIAAHP